MAKKLVTVFGATGRQGGSVAKALLKDDEFVVRAVTRNMKSEAAIKLKEQGAEICEADMDKKETLAATVKGAFACFIVTDFWSHMDQDRDMQQGLDALEACKTAGIHHVIYSGLESSFKLAGIAVPHFESKAVVEEKIRETSMPYTILRIAAYHENFPHFFVKRTHENTFGVAIPMEDKPWHLIHIGGLGRCVRTILKNADTYKGQTLGLASDAVTVDQIVDTFNKVFAPGKSFFNSNITADAFAELGFPGSIDLADMFRFLQTGKCERDVALTRKLNSDMLQFYDWVAENKQAIENLLDQQ